MIDTETLHNDNWRDGLGQDRSLDYQARKKVAAPGIGEDLAARLENLTIVLVPGFLSDTMRRDIYFGNHMRMFSKLPGVTVRMPEFDSEDPPKLNGDRIGTAINGYGSAGKRDIVLLTHSKGSLDTLYMLVGHPQVRARVAGWVSLQGAIKGSPVATCAADNPVLGPKVRRLLDALLDGEPESLESLRKVDAQRYVEGLVTSGQLATLATEVEMLFYGSSASYSLLLEPSRRAMECANLPNDGLMPMWNTFLPFAPYIAEPDGPDHAAPVMPGWPVMFDELQLASVLLSMCL